MEAEFSLIKAGNKLSFVLPAGCDGDVCGASIQQNSSLKQSEGSTPQHMVAKENCLAYIFSWFILFPYLDQ